MDTFESLRPLFVEAERHRKPVLRLNAKGLLVGIVVSSLFWIAAIYAVLYVSHLLRP